MIIFRDFRSLAVTKEVLPARKSLRLQNKEAEVLTLPPEPEDTPNSREVADMIQQYTSRLTSCLSTALWASFCLSFSLFHNLICFCVFFQAFSSQKIPRSSAHGSNQHGRGKQAAFTTSQALL